MTTPARRAHPPRRRALAALLAATGLALAACGDDADPGESGTAPTTAAADPASTAAVETTTTAAPAEPEGPLPARTIVFNGQGNDLVAYDSEPPFTNQDVFTNATDDPVDGRDINGQICFDPADPRRFVAGEDTAQTTTGDPGWGIFELSGDTVGNLEAEQVAKLVPTYQGADDNPENYGCGFLPDGRIVTTDIGNQAEGEPDGQLIVWFPPFSLDQEANRYCKVDVTLATGQGILVLDDRLLVAQARGAGVFAYDIAALPTDDTPEGGCDGTDATGAPLATGVARQPFIANDETNRLVSPNAIAQGPDGHLFVSSVFNGVISEFLPDGTFVRVVLEPPAGESLGAAPYSTGTPLGLAVDTDGTIYFADIGIVISDDGVGPGDRTGAVRRIRFVDGEPQPPEVLESGLAFPDGIGLLPTGALSE